MNMVSINLDRSRQRPSVRMETAPNEYFLCLIDTGALISVWTQRSFLLLRSFPNAVKTNYVTTVSGFGGKSLQKREIWEIPVFALKDRASGNEYRVNNLLVALVDNYNKTAYNMVLSSTIFHGSSYHIFDVDSPDKRIEIYPKENRPAMCVSNGIVSSSDLREVMPSDFVLEKDEVFIKGTTVFYENEIGKTGI